MNNYMSSQLRLHNALERRDSVCLAAAVVLLSRRLLVGNHNFSVCFRFPPKRFDADISREIRAKTFQLPGWPTNHPMFT